MLDEHDRLARREYIATHGRSRPSHAVRNDVTLREAAVIVLADVGWDEFSLSKVSAATGIAKTALYNRYDSKAALALAAWDRELFPTLTGALDSALRTGLAPDAAQPADDREAGHGDEDAGDFIHAMTTFAYPPPAIRAAVELVLASLVDPALHDAVLHPTRQWIADHITDTPDPIRAAQATAILVWAFGLVLFSTRPWVHDMDLTPALTRAHHALAHPTEPTPLPDAAPRHLHDSPFHTDDPRIDLALDNAMKAIGTIGYQRTRLIDIATATGVSDGFILLRYKTKLGVLRAVIDATYAQGYQEFTAFQDTIAAEHGPGIAEAVAWREYLNPHISDRQMLGMETDRLSLFNPTMRDVAFEKDLAVLQQQLNGTPDPERKTRTGHTHFDFAAGHGLPVIGLLLPEAWTLPFNVVTEAYLDTSATHKP